MLDHASITVSDFAAAERFYDAIMIALDVAKVGRSDRWLGYGERADAQHPDRVYIAIYKGPKPDEASSRHWCFKAKSRSEVAAFWHGGIAAGGTDDGPPGLRHYHAAYYVSDLLTAPCGDIDESADVDRSGGIGSHIWSTIYLTLRDQVAE